MSWLQAIFLGLIQGLTEFLPISSSAHLLIAGQLTGQADPGAAFTAVTQLGTESAVIIYFARDIFRIIKNWAGSLIGKVDQKDPDARMGWFIIVGSLPIGLLGLTLENYIDSTFRSLWVTVAMLGGVGLILAWADYLATKVRKPKDLTELNWKDALIYGLAQACALIPGVSRSGGTIAAGLFLGYSRPAATRYAFLLAIPAVFASGLYKLKDIGADAAVAWGPTLVATAIAGVVGYAVIAWLLRYITTHRFTPFVIYRIMLAGLIALLLISGVLA